jgi:hypothetical protein
LRRHDSEPDRAGSRLDLAVDDRAAARSELASRSLDLGEVQPVNEAVELSPRSDPDGHAITLEHRRQQGLLLLPRALRDADIILGSRRLGLAAHLIIAGYPR